MKILTAPLFLFVFLFNISSAQAEEFGAKAEGFVSTLADDAIQVFRTIQDEGEREKEFRRLLNEGFDVRAIGKWVLGRHWRKAKDAEKEEYLSLFEDFIIATYASRFEGYSDVDVTINVTNSVTRNENDAIVRSEIMRSGSNEPILVDWRVKSTKDNSLKIVDVIVAGVSMSQAQRSEFASVIKRNGGKVSGLIKVMKDKTSTLMSDTQKTAG